MALYNLNFGDLGWRGRLGVTLVTVLGLAAITALIIASVGLFLILLPVALVAVLIGRWRINKLMAADAARRKASAPRVIDAEYTVVNGDKRQP
ncbi:MAG: hypothetical protein WDM94_03010 [Bauldia sp.]